MTYALPAPSMKSGVALTEPTMANFIYLLGILNSGVSGIKSIQPFSIAITAGNTSATATITSVDTTKAYIAYNGVAVDPTAGAANAQHWFCRLALTNATTVTASRGGTTGQANVNGTVVEFN